jgi:hypothetical protein
MAAFWPESQVRSAWPRPRESGGASAQTGERHHGNHTRWRQTVRQRTR